MSWSYPRICQIVLQQQLHFSDLSAITMPQHHAIPWRKDFEPLKSIEKQVHRVEFKKKTLRKTTKTKIWHTLTYYHTDNVSTLITVFDTPPRPELAQGTSPKDSPKCWCAALGEVLLLRICSSRERIRTASAAARKLPQKKHCSQELFASTLAVDFLNSFGRDPRLRRPLTRIPQPGNCKDIRIRCKNGCPKEVANIACQRQFRFLSWHFVHIDMIGNDRPKNA